MYRSQRSGGSMMWMSLSRTRNPLCAMIRLSSRCRGHLTPRAPHDTPPGTVGHRLEAALLVLRGDPDGPSLRARGEDRNDGLSDGLHLSQSRLCSNIAKNDSSDQLDRQRRAQL